MEPRTTGILKAVISEFIESGEPVSSEWLYEHHDFGIKPAMIRLELGGLTDKGYLVQPHTAAGRVPSDKGLAFFAKSAIEEDAPACGEELLGLFREQAWPEFLSEFSSELDILGAASVFPERAAYKSMLTNLVDHFDWPPSEIRDLVRDFENLDERLGKMGGAFQSDIQAFIGRKSPVTRSEHLAVIAGSYGVDGHRVFVCAIGPKRMDYKKTAKVMKGLKIASRK